MAKLGTIFSNIFSCRTNSRLLKERVIILKDRHETITFDFLLRRSEEGIPYYQTDLSYCYLYGFLNTPIDIDKGLYWLNKAVAGKDKMAIHNLTTLYKDGTFYEKDLKKAIKLFKQSAKMGLGRSWNDLGVIYEGKNKIKKAEKCYLNAIKIDGQDYMAKENLGKILVFKSGNSKDLGINEFIELINSGSIRGHLHYAYCLYKGFVVQRDFEKSAKVLLDLIEKLKHLQEDINDNERKDITDGIIWFATRFHLLSIEYEEAGNHELATLFRNVAVHSNLPSLYYKFAIDPEFGGLGYDFIYNIVSPITHLPFIFELKRKFCSWPLSDIKTATRGAEKNEPEEICFLGCLYFFGREDYNGKKGGYEEAYNLFQKASSLGYGAARYWSAVCLEEGLGTKKNEQAAIELYNEILNDGKIEPFWFFALNLRQEESNKLLIDSKYRLGKLLLNVPDYKLYGINLLSELMKYNDHDDAALALCKFAIKNNYKIEGTDFDKNIVKQNLQQLSSFGVGETYKLLAEINETELKTNEAEENYLKAFIHGEISVANKLFHINHD